MSDLIQNLRDLANHKNHDLTLADEAADRIAELEKVELQWLTYRNEIGKVEDSEKEVARLSTHIRAIADHHKEELDWHEMTANPSKYHKHRRDFALSGLEAK